MNTVIDESRMQFIVQHDTNNGYYRVEVWFNSQCFAGHTAKDREELQAVVDDVRDLVALGINTTVRNLFQAIDKR